MATGYREIGTAGTGTYMPHDPYHDSFTIKEGWTCSICGRFIPWGWVHTCGGAFIKQEEPEDKFCPHCGRKLGVTTTTKYEDKMNPKLAKLLKIIDACFIVWPIIKQAIIHLYKFVMDTFDEIVEKWSEALR